MTVTPLQARVLIRRATAEQTTASGIILTETKEMFEGEVVSVGPDVTNVKSGDYILFGPYSGGNYVQSNGEKLLVLKEEEILAVVDKG